MITGSKMGKQQPNVYSDSNSPDFPLGSCVTSGKLLNVLSCEILNHVSKVYLKLFGLDKMHDFPSVMLDAGR